MKYYKTWILILAFALAVSAKAQVTAEKRAEIDKLLRLTGMEKLVEQMKTQMLSGLKTSMPGASAAFWDKFSTKMDARELIEKIVPIYDKYYTIDDLRAVNTFYSSPAGQKILATLPQIMQESMAVGQAWGQETARKAEEELAAANKADTK